jgi:cAMP phosphodiesterase
MLARASVFLSLDDMSRIKHIFITHSHLAHIVSIAFLVDTLFDDLIAQPLVVHAPPETIKALRDHNFNWTIWPNFTELPHKHNAVLKLEAMVAGSVYTLLGRDIEIISVNHAVPGVGYCIESERKVFASTGDTTSNDNFWACLNKHNSVD